MIASAGILIGELVARWRPLHLFATASTIRKTCYLATFILAVDQIEDKVRGALIYANPNRIPAIRLADQKIELVAWGHLWNSVDGEAKPIPPDFDFVALEARVGNWKSHSSYRDLPHLRLQKGIDPSKAIRALLAM